MDDSNKIYPQTSQEMANLLGITKKDAPASATRSPFPDNLPVLDAEVVSVVPEKTVAGVTVTDTPVHEITHEPVPEVKNPQTQILSYAKIALPYVLFFIVGIFVYYFFFSTFSFQSLLNNFPTTTVEQKDNALDTLKKSQLANYEAWIKKFYFDVSDASVIDPDTDNSGNGLTNFEKFILGLNPKAYDTLGRGVADGQSIVQGIDPSTGKPLGEARKKLVQDYFDLEVISNRISIGSFQNSNANVNSSYPQPIPRVAPGTDLRGTPASPQYNEPAPPPATPIIDQQPPQQPPVIVSQAPPAAATPRIASSTIKTAQAAAPEPYEGENKYSIDTSKPALLTIPSLNVSVPLIWTKYSKNFTSDLKKGVVHYPGTVLPGDQGTSYISGHSSNYTFVKSPYNYVFSKLGDLKDLSSFTITATLKNGKKATLHYVVQRRGMYKPNDQAQFVNTSESLVALSTCWPPGTIADRLVAYGKLSQVEQ